MTTARLARAVQVALLHPGEMGARVGAALIAGGVQVTWASEGRSEDTRTRASQAGLVDRKTLAETVAGADVVVSVCPPHATRDIARTVADLHFGGVYVDANAVAPATARAMAADVQAGGASFVDASIIGPPPVEPGTTRLLLSGEQAAAVAALFAASPLEPVVVPGGPGAASAVKAAYAAWTKASAALLLAARALARAEGVESELVAEWRRSQPELPACSELAAVTNGPKAWRFVGEMEEQASAFAAAGLPDGFPLAAAEIYGRLARFKGSASGPSLSEVLDVLVFRTARSTPGAPRA